MKAPRPILIQTLVNSLQRITVHFSVSAEVTQFLHHTQTATVVPHSAKARASLCSRTSNAQLLHPPTTERCDLLAQAAPALCAFAFAMRATHSHCHPRPSMIAVAEHDLAARRWWWWRRWWRRWSSNVGDNSSNCRGRRARQASKERRRVWDCADGEQCIDSRVRLACPCSSPYSAQCCSAGIIGIASRTYSAFTATAILALTGASQQQRRHGGNGALGSGHGEAIRY